MENLDDGKVIFKALKLQEGGNLILNEEQFVKEHLKENWVMFEEIDL